jgi:hypothetical protein
MVLKSLPSPGTVVVEFPLGEWVHEVRYVFYRRRTGTRFEWYSGQFR